MPGVEMAKHGLGDHRRSKALMPRGLHQMFAGQSVQRVSHRRDTGVELVGKERRLEALAWSVGAFTKALPYCGIDAVERSRRTHPRRASRRHRLNWPSLLTDE